MNKKTKAGFTLIELLVVVLIIGILAAVAVPQYQKAVKKAYMREVISLMHTVAKAENVYRLANGSYTADASALDISIPWTGKRYQIHLFLIGFGQGWFHSKGADWEIHYHIPSNRLYCRPVTSEYCKSLGGIKTRHPFDSSVEAFLIE